MRGITFLGKIIEGKLVWTHKRTTEAVKHLFRRFEGKSVEVTFARLRRMKTLEQLGYYYAVILPTIHQQMLDDGIDVYGVPITQEMADKVVKAYCARIDDDSNIVPVPYEPQDWYEWEKATKNMKRFKKRNMTKMQAMVFIDNAIRWANHKLNCDIPPAAQV